MPNNDPLYELVRTVAGTVPGGETAVSSGRLSSQNGSDLDEALSANTAQLASLRSLFQSQTEATNENTRTIAENTTSHTASSVAAAAGDLARNVAGGMSGFLLSPIVSGLMKLFGGGQEEAPAPLEKFAIPAPVRIDAGVGGGTSGFVPVDYQQNGMPRPASSPAPNVTVQVSAMDSQSFLDRSEDIANAVRRAMLESSSLNDVVSEL